MKNFQNAFSNISHQLSMGRVPTEKFGVAECVYQKFVKINFRGRGPQKLKILGLFSKMCRNFYFLNQQQKVPNFCEKNVFLSCLTKKLWASNFGRKTWLIFFSSLPIFEKRWGQNSVPTRFVVFWQSSFISRIKMLKTNLKNRKLFLLPYF